MGRCRVCNTGLNRIASRDQVLFMTDETDDEALWDEQSGFKEEKRGRVVRDDNGYQLGLILTQLSRIADSLEELVKEIKAK